MLKKVVALSSTLVLTIAAVGTTVWAASGHHRYQSYNYQTSGNVTGFSAYSSSRPSGELAVSGCMVTNGTSSYYVEVEVSEVSVATGTILNSNQSSITTNSGGTGTNIPRNRILNTIRYEHAGCASPASYPGFHVDSYSYTAYQDY